MPFRIHFHDVPHSQQIRAECEKHADTLREEFPETSKFEVTISQDRGQHETHVHVTGKDLELASRGKGREMGESVVEAFTRVRRQLRRHHDKIVTVKRREGHKASHEPSSD